ncbi:MAG: chemotaxis protein CheW [Timaviella obliquedivisa GSE-PSE-MK23-08B]|jgi:purine-binding chemotaxis protein CheW|nr:chemotaxis protein CheW [Timaviella obliquedivisa GSE-PSE-MK23-08B]
MQSTISSPFLSSSSDRSQESVRVITFMIANQMLALPMNAIVKVVSCPPQMSGSTNSIELFHFGQRVITVLNLHKHFTQSLEGSSGKFLVITQIKHKELYAFLVDTPPDLIDLPASTIRQIPESYRHGHALSIASCVAVLSKEEGLTSIFIIEVEQMIRALRAK